MKTAFPSHITVLLYPSASFLAYFLFHSPPVLIVLFTWTLISSFSPFAPFLFKADFFIFFLFLCRTPSDSIMSEDAVIEPRTVATLAFTAIRSEHSARSHSFLFVAAACVVCLSISLPSAITACVTVTACLWGLLYDYLLSCVAVCLTLLCVNIWISVFRAFLSVCSQFVSLPPVILCDCCLSLYRLLLYVCCLVCLTAVYLSAMYDVPVCVAVCFFATPSSVWLSVCLAFLSCLLPICLSSACQSVCWLSVFVQLAAFYPVSRVSFCVVVCLTAVCQFAVDLSVWLSIFLLPTIQCEYLSILFSVCCPYVSLPPVILSAACLSFSSLLHSVCLPFLCLPEFSWTPSYVCLQSWTLSTCTMPLL